VKHSLVRLHIAAYSALSRRRSFCMEVAQLSLSCFSASARCARAVLHQRLESIVFSGPISSWLSPSCPFLAVVSHMYSG